MLSPELARNPLVPRLQFGAWISGLGSALPINVVANDEAAERAGVDDAWIERRTGISARRHLADGERLDALAARAGQAALEDAGVPAADVDLVLVATTSSDELIPGAAPQVAAILGADRAGAYDIASACTGFVAGLSSAAASVESGRCRHVLLVGADGLSRFAEQSDRKVGPLFGDGAGAVLVSATSDGSALIGPVVQGADGCSAGLITVPRSDPRIRMDGHATFVEAVRRLCDVVPQAAAAVGHALDDVDLFVFHQANRRILASVGDALGLAPEKVVDSIGALGNTSAASIPLSLDHARTEGQLRNGARVLLAAVGAGFVWGATVVEWGRR